MTVFLQEDLLLVIRAVFYFCVVCIAATGLWLLMVYSLVCLSIFITNPAMTTVMLLVALTGVWWLVWATIPFVVRMLTIS